MDSQSFNCHKCPLIIWDSLKETKVNSPFYDMIFNHASKCCSYSCENIMKNEGRETQNNIFISDLKDLLRSMRVMTSTVEVLQTNFSDDALKTCRHITGH